MGTKNNPGSFDCYAAAKPDEPIFIFRASDELSPWIVRIWAAARNLQVEDMQGAIRGLVKAVAQKNKQADPAKIQEALQCAFDMEAWLLKDKYNVVELRKPKRTRTTRRKNNL